MIRLGQPSIGTAEEDAIAEVLRSGYLVQGAKVAEFEALLAHRVGTPHCAAVSNGTAALHLALMALGIGRGDAVAVPTFSWPATANAVELVGAVPVFVDIEPDTLGMDPRALATILANRTDVRAILPVHAFGRMCDVEALVAIADAHGIPLIEDAACALGAIAHDRPAGAWGVMGCFSFHPRKAVTTGEGGAVSCRFPEHLRLVRSLRNHGLDPEAPVPDFVRPGFNYRLSEVQAALGIVQLSRLTTLIARRRAIAAWYSQELADTGLGTPSPGAPGSHVFQSYVVQLPPALAPMRAELIARLRTGGVEVTIGTYHMPGLRYYRERYGDRTGEFPVGEAVAARSLSLPMHGELRDEDVQCVVQVVKAHL